MKGIAFVYCMLFCLLISCRDSVESSTHVFKTLTIHDSGIQFENTLIYDEHFNAYTYRNFYNGAGVALGDINNDGLLDIYFCGNEVDNKLYLNKGNFTFEDITERAGVACHDVWSTGVSMADINGDGWLDFFVCKSGPPRSGVRHNELFINNGDLTFTESSEVWGVADSGLSIHAVFFDYDKDSDLDFYLLNNSNRSVGIYDLKVGQREIRDPFGGNKLYRNDRNHFTDVSESAGIYGSAIGFGLGVTAADVNRDGWPDLFVSNDFFERDYLYINNQDGTFTESLEAAVNETSLGSMGADIADLNNDGYPEIYVTEMLPETLDRVRTKTIFEDWDKYSANVVNGYYHQFTRNVLQLNNGPIPGNEQLVSFSEISRYTGMHATDWSWGALIFDYNNDGKKDVFVANGIAKDLTDQDYINFEASAMLTSANLKSDSLLLKKLMDRIPSVPLSNYLFENQGKLNFNNKSLELGLGLPGFSNGAAYGDLDNDGDLDLVVNNINAPASVYKNHSSETRTNHFLQIQFIGTGKNTFGFGTQVTAYCGSDQFYFEQAPVRGYLSSIDPKVHIGLGTYTQIDSLVIRWPDGSYSLINNVPTDQLLVLKESDLEKSIRKNPDHKVNRYLTPLQTSLNKIKHAGSSFNDFNRDRLLFEMCTNEGPGTAIADVNGDGLQDVFIGGAVNQSGTLWIQITKGDFRLSPQPDFEIDKRSDDVRSVFFDANGDGHIDLYVASGGHQYSFQAPEYKDRLYLNNGKGNFKKIPQILVSGDLQGSTSFVVPLDFNQDGKEDLIVGNRLIPFYYGKPASVYLWQNNGNEMFSDVTREYASEWINLGLTRDASLIDYDKDGDLDVVIVGEWMEIKLFQNTNGYFRNVTKLTGLAGMDGLWTSVKSGDFNNDGYIDFAVGNQGLNSRLHASKTEPLVMYVHDFDKNGSLEQLICQRYKDQDFPLALLPDLWKQIPVIKKDFTRFEQYKNASLLDLFNESQREGALILQAHELRSGVFLNKGGKRFDFVPLPAEAQFSKLYSMLTTDFDQDGNLDLLVGGNQHRVKPEMGIQDGSYGLMLKGDGNGSFLPVSSNVSGIYVRGQIRDIKSIQVGKSNAVLISRFNDVPGLYKYSDQ
jgi:hypothetical protein